ncbi:hypothetical protein BASA81_000812 [Batrachochytrium salamandrivorans]|nr:hypothetical protein BASA81_000812 [Batrachochytrium salamandrivorans]
MVRITYQTTEREVLAYLDNSNNNATARRSNPSWYETKIGQHLAMSIALFVLSCGVWLSALSWWIVGLVSAPGLFALAEFGLPKYALLGNSSLEFTLKLTLWAMGFAYAHLAIKVVLLIVLALVAIIGPSVYYPLSFKRLGEDNTMLHLALFQGTNRRVVKLLVDGGADVNAINSLCDTPLHFAVKHSLDAVLLLLDAGANVNAENCVKKVPLDYASKPAVAELLLRRGSRVNAKWAKLGKELGIAAKLELHIPPNLGKRLTQGETLCFLSHSKSDAAGTAMYLHSALAHKLQCDSHQIFLDSNSLVDLRDLASLVKQTKVLIVLQTGQVLQRPFCLVEMFAAVQYKIPIVPVIIEGRGYSFEHAKQSLASLCGGEDSSAVAALQQAGYDVGEVASTLSSVLPNLISKPFNPSASERVRASQLEDICAAIVAAL